MTAKQGRTLFYFAAAVYLIALVLLLASHPGRP